MSASGSVSTVSRDDNLDLSSEDSSSPDESELELGLGLSLTCGVFKAQQQASSGIGQYARALTAKDLPSVASASSLSSLASPLSRGNYVTAGTKRTADSVAAANGSSQVVGWPPIRAYRMNSMVNHAKPVACEEYNSMVEKSRRQNTVIGKTTDVSNKNSGSDQGRTSLLVKVNMDGIPIGRKIDLSALSCYETLAQTLEDMFHGPTTRSGVQEHNIRVEATRPSKLLDGTSDFVLTYQDKEGDLMLVGDVPWGLFLSSVKRLRITRVSEATGLAAAPRLQESNGRQRNRTMAILSVFL